MLTQERAEKLMEYLNQDEARTLKLLELDPEAALAEINAEGYDFSADELYDFGQALASVSKKDEGEISADELDDVAGGSVTKTVVTFCTIHPNSCLTVVTTTAGLGRRLINWIRR